MRERLQHDGRTALIDAADRYFVLEAMQWLAADGTLLRRMNDAGAARPLLFEDVDDLGEDVAALDSEGNAREPYFTRLRTLVAACDRRGMVVDVMK